MIRTGAVVAFIALGIVLVFPWLIVWSLFVGNPELLYGTAIRAIRVACRMAGLRIRTEGLENIPPRACIFAANHTSNLDPPALVAVIPRRVSFLAKKEIFRIPILATAMRVAQFVPVDRASRESATASVDIAAQRLKEGLSFAVFPRRDAQPRRAAATVQEGHVCDGDSGGGSGGSGVDRGGSEPDAKREVDAASGRGDHPLRARRGRL